MKSVNIGDLKNNLSRYLLEVRQGGSVLVKETSQSPRLSRCPGLMTMRSLNWRHWPRTGR
jgi:hypothetical protein